MADYLDQITDLINTAKDAADMLTRQAGEIETLTIQRDRALSELNACRLEIRKVENERERAVDLWIETKQELDRVLDAAPSADAS